MANHVKYLDFVGLAKFNETVNQRLYKRLKYMGELELNAAARVDWNDIAPCTIGHMYVLTGDEGESVVIDDVEYTVGDTIYATNDVSGNETTPVDVTVNKISAGSKAIVQTYDLDDIANPKEYLFYEVINDDNDDVELYVYRGSTWHEVIRHPFSIVEDKLPDAADLVEDKMILLKEDETDPDDASVVIHKAGLWFFDKATETYVDMAEPIDEDFINDLEIED